MATKRLNILSVNAVHHGESNGRQWTLYEVVALNAQGEHIEHKLRSFDELPLGDGDYEVEARDYKGEKQYTLKRPGSGPGASSGGNPGARLGPKVDELRERLDAAERQLAWALDEINGLKAVVTQLLKADGKTPPTLDDPAVLSELGFEPTSTPPAAKAPRNALFNDDDGPTF